jgi:hypothetical protein
MPLPTVSVVAAETNSEGVQDDLRHQTFRDFEIIIASQPLPAALNQATQKAQGDFVAFLGADQLWTPDKFERQILALRQNPDLQWCYCDAFFSDGKTRFSEITPLHRGNIIRPLLLRNFIPSGSVLVNRTLFNALGGFDESGAYAEAEEWELWIRIAAGHEAALVNEPLLCLPPALPATEQQQISMKRVVESAVARQQPHLKDLRSESLAEICISAGNAHLRANQRDQARFHFAEALTHSPLRPDAYLSWISSFLSSEAQQQIRDLHNLSRQLQRSEKPTPSEKISV